jgi:DNA replicative helicase MCM subunit Mcm2 (Cdc46/Mcm family)
MPDFKTIKNLWYCKSDSCQCNKSLDMVSLCKSKHPEMLVRVIEMQGDKVVAEECENKITPFANINAHHINDLIMTECILVQLSEQSIYNIEKIYSCPERNCRSTHTMYVDDYKEIYSKDTFGMCEEHNIALKYNRDNRITGDLKKVMFQEPTDSGSVNPRSIKAHLTGGNARIQLNAGKKYRIVSRVLTTVDSKKNDDEFVLDVIQIRCLDEKTDEQPTALEISIFKEINQTKVIESLAPHVIHRTNIKLASIIAYLSGGKKDGERWDMSVLFVGDPSTGKSAILDKLKELDKRSFKISGRSSSSAGMVMGVDNLSDGTRMAKFGPVILANGSYVCIDELDKMRPEDQSSLHDVMESQVAHLNKVGINITMPARTKIMGAANPVKSNWETSKTVMQNINMPASFIARFGYVFLLLNDFTDEMEDNKYDAMGYINDNGIEAYIEKENLLSTSDLIKFLNYANTLDPKFDEGVFRFIHENFKALRKITKNRGILNIDTRTFRDILRGSYAFAKLSLSDKVTRLHAQQAIDLYQASLDSFGADSKEEHERLNMTAPNTLESII